MIRILCNAVNLREITTVELGSLRTHVGLLSIAVYQTVCKRLQEVGVARQLFE
jgi:hypothetical protein